MGSEVRVKVSLLTGGVSTGLAKVKSQFSEFRHELNSEFASFVAFGSIVAGLEAMVRKATEISNVSHRFGAPAAELQRVANVARHNGASIEDVARSWNKLEVNRQKAIDGSDEIRRQFDALGISMKEVATLPIDQLFYRVADATHGAEDRGKAYAATVAIMGRNAGQLYSTLEHGAGAIKAQGDEMGVMSDTAVERLHQVDIQIEKMKNLVFVYGGEVLIFIKNVAESIGAVIGSVVNRVEAVADAAVAVVKMMNAGLHGKVEIDLTAMSGIFKVGEELKGLGKDLDAIWSRKAPVEEGPKDKRPLDMEIDPSNKEAAAAEKLRTMRERLAELQRQAGNQELETQEKINALIAQRTALLKEAGTTKDEESKLSIQIKAAEVAKEIAIAQKQLSSDQERSAERISQLNDRLEKAESDRIFAGLRTRDERIAFLNNEVATLDKEINDEKDQEKNVELRIRREEVIRHREEEEKHDEQPVRVSADSLQRIGGGGNVASVSGSDRSLKEAQTHTGLLRQLVKNTTDLKGGKLLMK
jgi:hypothetical protein